MAEQHTFSVTMEYLREIVAKQTFRDSPPAALRELIQNAHDACLVASALTGSSDYSVHITLDPSEKTITIQDNGIGMTQQDIHEYLTTVGRGKKGPMIAAKYGIPERNARRLENVIGEFGFGFIAAFIIADRIELWTRSGIGGSPSIHCVFSTEGVSYEMEVTNEAVDQGTKLVLHLNNQTLSRGLRPTDNPIEGNILSWDTVDTIVKKYGIFLEFPIFVSMHGEPSEAPSNQIEPPWEVETRLRESAQHFYDSRIGKGNLGEVLHTIRLCLSRQRGDSVTLDGILVLEDAPLAEDSSPGNLEVFVKRMWVCERESSLLPAWASFLRGVIVTPELRPLPGRDALDKHHDGYDRVKSALHRIVFEAFLDLARNSVRVFNRMSERYGRTFRMGLIEEKRQADESKQEFLEAELLRYVRFIRYGKRYLQGNICTLNDYLGVASTEPLEFKDRKRVVHIVARPIRPERQLEFRRLLASKALDVIVPNDESEFGLLMNVDDIFSDVVVRNIENELLKTYAGLLEGEQRNRWQAFLKYYQELSATHHMAGADVGDLEPEYMPALILNVPSDDLSKGDGKPEESDEAKMGLAIRRSMVPDVPDAIAEIYRQTLVINSRNATLKELLDYKESMGLQEVDEVLDVCLHECYHMALEAALDSMPAGTLKHHVDFRCLIIQGYLKSHRERFNQETSDRQVRDELADLQEKLAAFRRQFGEIDVEGEAKHPISVPAEPVERMGVVVFCDMVSSTGSLMGMGFAERGFVLNEFVKLAKSQVQHHGGFFDKFTGDGLVALFGIENEPGAGNRFTADQWASACTSAWVFSTAMEQAMIAFNARDDIDAIIQRNQLKQFSLRTAIHPGLVLFGSFGAAGTAVGLPVIVAARLCAEKEAFEKAQASILVTESFRTESKLPDFHEVPYKFEPKGTGRTFGIFAHSRARH